MYELPKNCISISTTSASITSARTSASAETSTAATAPSATFSDDYSTTTFPTTSTASAASSILPGNASAKLQSTDIWFSPPLGLRLRWVSTSMGNTITEYATMQQHRAIPQQEKLLMQNQEEFCEKKTNCGSSVLLQSFIHQEETNFFENVSQRIVELFDVLCGTLISPTAVARRANY